MEKEKLKKELDRLYKSLDFASDNFLSNKKLRKKDSQRFFNIYQQLGIAWEFLGLQCKHWDGYRLTRDKKEVCKICGKVKGVEGNYYLLPKEGRKKIGVRLVPNSRRTFPTKAKATIVNDTVNFHGALLNVSVTNSYKSSLPRPVRSWRPHRSSGSEITIAADRIVTLKERGIECRIDRRLINVKVQQPKKPKTVYGGFPWELKRKDLKNFPVIFDFDKNHRFLGLTILA